MGIVLPEHQTKGILIRVDLKKNRSKSILGQAPRLDDVVNESSNNLTVNFGMGETQETRTLTVFDDTLDEGGRTMVLYIRNADYFAYDANDVSPVVIAASDTVAPPPPPVQPPTSTPSGSGGGVWGLCMFALLFTRKHMK